MAVEKIDSEGDVTIDCAGSLFYVSSKVLSIASPVFSAMFKPVFQEGIAISTQFNPVVKLPEDDPDAFRIFANIAHHNAQNIPEKPGPRVLGSLAVLSDKYKCAHSIIGHGRAWLQEITSTKGHPETDLWPLLQFAYALELQKSFSEVARQLVQTHCGKFRTSTFAIAHMGILPEGVLDQLDHNHDALGLKTTAAIMALAEMISKHKCPTCHAFVGTYIQKLGHAGLLPGTARFNGKSFLQVRKAAQTLNRYTLRCKSHDPTDGPPKQPLTEQREFLLGMLEVCSVEEVEMCLECVSGGSCTKHNVDIVEKWREEEARPDETFGHLSQGWSASGGDMSAPGNDWGTS